MKTIIPLILLTCISGAGFATSATDSSKLRPLFLKIENQLKQGNSSLFSQHEQKIIHYPLYPYLKYRTMNKSLQKIGSKQINHYTQKYADSPLAEKLKKDWLFKQAKHGNWKSFLQVYKDNGDIELECYAIWAHYKTGNKNRLIDAAPNIWLHGNSRPKSCDPVFTAWEKQGGLTRNLIWQRIKLAIENRNTGLARYLGKSLEASERPLLDLWIRTYYRPELIQSQQYYTSKHPAVVEMLAHTLVKLAKKDPVYAIRSWQKITKKHQFNDRQWRSVVKAIAVSLAHRQHPSAEKWLKKVSPESADQRVLNAQLKLALVKSDWQKILQLTSNTPDQNSELEKWQYWHARALEKMGQRNESQQLLAKVAETRSYYGFLSSMRILKPYAFKMQGAKVTEKDIEVLTYKPSIQRAQELLALGRVTQAHAEWRHGLKTLNDHEKQVAAKLAQRMHMPNWSILALAKAENKDDLNLRFPRTYSNFILRESRKNKLDPALVFAVTRQESAFIPTARSSAGALGLMQIIPSTAKMVAKDLNIPFRNHKDLFTAEKNITLGSNYLKQMMEKNQDNSVLAMAAYNAGPRRVTQWLPEFDMPADTWIETIPFSETRNYVQNVLTYTLIYQQLLGKTPQLAAHMPIINGKRRYSKQR